MGSKNRKQKIIREDVCTLGNIINPNGGRQQWDYLPQGTLPESYKKAYKKLTENIGLAQWRVKPNNYFTNIFFMEGRIVDGAMVWEFQIPRKEMVAAFCMGQYLESPRRTFCVA